jgi:ATP-binding cassette subfamily B multidrug efflux pump
LTTFTSFSRRYAVPLWGWYSSGFVLLAAVNLISLQIPQLAKSVINTVSESGDLSPTADTALAIIGLGFLMIIIRALSRLLIFWPGRRIETEAKSDLFARLLHLPQTFFARFGMGDLISRLANDVGQLRAFFAFGLLQIMNVIFLTVFTIAQMVSAHAMLTLLSLLPLALMLVITRFAMPRMHAYSRDNQQALGSLTNRVTEAFVNVHVIQANAATETFAARADADNERVFRTNMQLTYLRMLVFPLMSLLAGLSQLVVLFYGGNEILAGRLTVGDILAFNVYIALLTFPLTALGMILAMYQRAKTALERIGVIDAAPCEGALPLAAAAEDRATMPLLEVRNLTFTYDAKGDEPAMPPRLSNVSFSLKPGARLGLFGPIGSGKSTLFALLTRLADAPPGTIFWQGKDVLTSAPDELRDDVGYALQTVHLFSDTVAANLGFGLEPPPTEAQLTAAAEQAQMLADIQAMPDGWQTQIGEKGVRLSGGQKQRLALARLFLREQKLLLLDDVLSAVDQRTEKKLIDAIYARGSALIIASHRGSALKRCDEILILDHGRIVDRGTFADLVPRHPELGDDPQ